eukprot:TRINITY_DN5014_c0_g1_i1.p1 TRINITY_DN5014_c0_g1~~TRINITY_DN5014_c0_g1_i1.p1  ORF type:complete len:846 (+),score=307.48 TRINITY_DN5014_c0_g1_i1:135-2672(+)
MSREGVLPRYSGMVLPSSENPIQFLDLTSKQTREFIKNQVKFISDLSKKDETKSISHIVVSDFNTYEGVKLASDALKSLRKEDSLGQKSSRVGFIHNGAQKSQLLDSILAAQKSQSASKTNAFVFAAVENALESLKNQKEGVDFSFDPKGIVESNGLSFDSVHLKQSDNNHQKNLILLRELGITSPSTIITNGRIVKIPKGSNFNDLDFDLLTRFEFNSRTKPVEEAFESVAFEGVDPDLLNSDYIANAIMGSASLLGIDEANEVQKAEIPNLERTLTIDSTNGTEPVFEITVILNPLSRDAQRLSPILEMLKNIFPTKIHLILKPEELSNLPLKTYYSSSMSEKLAFDREGRNIGASVKFQSVPKDRLLTLAMDTPQSWLVGPVISKFDLDNIKLEALGKDSTLFARFELQSIILQGHCSDTKGSPPRGLQVVLGTSQKPFVTDTLVMANYGYFQLKANPGVWSLRIKPNSRSSALYDIVQSDSIIPEKQTIITSFGSEIASLVVQKKLERFSESLLQEESEGGNEVEEDDSVWGSISSLWGSEDKPKKSTDDTIHVFSLASGHLYERFLKIMMLSAVKNTKNPVKFWLLANFLSPQFKDSIPSLARAYNFEYELVTYKWPSWLFAQTEKQRIIWAYKILFLDVLFPIGLKKVIYVDADQVVRADLKELWEMDLHGAPYAYTPFCDSNTATEGFRFWKKGFWESHLSGTPYHISALYVVDLLQFRKQAAGDQLRGTYSQLAPDPNSLSNLDQDLPNYVQRNIKIFSLPQEWLWCETWCSNDTKSSAKTIDLCNNPLTKTPKLEAAVKIIPEWTDLDNEVKRVEREAASADKSTTNTNANLKEEL